MPKPKENESQSDFVDRCMAYGDMQKYEPDQRAAICHSMYKENKNMQEGRTTVAKTLKSLQTVITNLENEKVHKSIVNEIPVHTISIFNPSGQERFKSVYIDNRLAGKSKDDSLRVTLSIITRSYKDNQMVVLKGIQRELNKIKKGFYTEETKPEGWGPDRNEIPVIDEFDDQDEEEKVGKADYKEGQTKMIFGKPFTFSGGKWVPDESDGKKETEPSGEEDTTTDGGDKGIYGTLIDAGFTYEELDNMSQEDIKLAYAEATEEDTTTDGGGASEDPQQDMRNDLNQLATDNPEMFQSLLEDHNLDINEDISNNIEELLANGDQETIDYYTSTGLNDIGEGRSDDTSWEENYN